MADAQAHAIADESSLSTPLLLAFVLLISIAAIAAEYCVCFMLKLHEETRSYHLPTPPEFLAPSFNSTGGTVSGTRRELVDQASIDNRAEETVYRVWPPQDWYNTSNPPALPPLVMARSEAEAQVLLKDAINASGGFGGVDAYSSAGIRILFEGHNYDAITLEAIPALRAYDSPDRAARIMCRSASE